MKPCKHCLSSENYVDYIGYPQQQITGIGTISPIQVIPCKFCGGEGYIDETKLITVQRKYVKDEYFNHK
jgi:hypothetical protein